MSKWKGMERCGEPTARFKEPCFRLKGHRHEHRGQYAVDNAYVMRMGHERIDRDDIDYERVKAGRA